PSSSKNVVISDSRLQRKRSGLSSDSLKFSDDASIFSSSTAGRAGSSSGGRFRFSQSPALLVFHHRHYVFCSDSSAEKTAAAAAAFGFEFKSRRSSCDERRHSRVDRQREGNHRDRESG